MTATPPRPGAAPRIPATVVTGFLGAGKTTLLRHLLAHNDGRRLAVIVNEFGTLGIDGDTLRACAVPGCEADDVIELSNGCLCCTVAEDFLPAMERLLARTPPPEHILIETSGLALPKPLLKAFDWPAVRARVTVDGVIAVVDAPAVLAGRFADDPDAVARQRAADPALAHASASAASDEDNPLAEVFEDQLTAADLVVLNKADLLDAAGLEAARAGVRAHLSRAVPVLDAREGVVDPRVLLGLEAAAEDDLAARPSHHDAEDGAHEHDDFESFVVTLPEQDGPEPLLGRIAALSAGHDVLRLKGFVPVRGRPMRLGIQAVGPRVRHAFEGPWPGERQGRLVVIGRTGLDRGAIAGALGGGVEDEGKNVLF